MRVFGSMIKSCDLAILVVLGIMLYLYVRALVALRGDENRGFARNLCLGIVVGWTGSLVLYANLNYVYWFGHVEPTTSLASPAVRLVYTFLTLGGSSMHIATSLSTRSNSWRPLALILLAVAMFVALVTGLDLNGYI